MAEKELWVGSVGPFLYDNADTYADGVSFRSFRGDQIYLATAPAHNNEVVRLIDLLGYWQLVVVVDIDNPTELYALIGTQQGSTILAYQAAAGANPCTLYMWDTSSPSTDVPYIMASTGGSWVAFGGKYCNSSIYSANRFWAKSSDPMFVSFDTDAALPQGLWRLFGNGSTWQVEENTHAAGTFGSKTVVLQFVTGGYIAIPPLTASRLLALDASKQIAVVTAISAWIAGTANQITVTDDGDGTITLSLPQDIHTGASPTFVGETLSGLTASRLVASSGAKALASVSALSSWLAGTAGQVTVTDDGDGTATLAALGLLGDGTAGRVLRVSRLLIEDGTTAGTIKCTLTSIWNGDAIAVTDNIAVGTTGNWTHEATRLIILNAGITGDPLFAFGVLGTNDAQVSLYPFVQMDSNNINIRLRDDTSGASCGTNLNIHNTVHVGDVSIDIIYLTSA